MKPHMLQSQFDLLEEPIEAITVDVSLPVRDIVDAMLERLKDLGEMANSLSLPDCYAPDLQSILFCMYNFLIDWRIS